MSIKNKINNLNKITNMTGIADMVIRTIEIQPVDSFEIILKIIKKWSLKN